MTRRKEEEELKRRLKLQRIYLGLLAFFVVVLLIIDIVLLYLFLALKKYNTFTVRVQGVTQEEAKTLERYLNQSLKNESAQQ